MIRTKEWRLETGNARCMFEVIGLRRGIGEVAIIPFQLTSKGDPLFSSGRGGIIVEIATSR